MGNANVVGPTVRSLRKKRVWTQEQLAARLQLNGYWLTREVIANIETQRSGVTDFMLRGLAKVFKVPMDELFPNPSD
jgi:transcriptional regulator with XRE-family HTH domain